MTHFRRYTQAIAVIVGCAGLIFLATQLEVVGRVAQVAMSGQTLNVTMPRHLPVDVEVIDAGPSELPPNFSAQGRGVPVRLNETLELVAHIDTLMPLKTTVHYRGTIPVKISVPLNTTFKARVFGMDLNIPVSGQVPLDLQLPVNLSIPIDQPIRLLLDAPVRASVDQIVHIPFRANLKTRISFLDRSVPVSFVQPLAR